MKPTDEHPSCRWWEPEPLDPPPVFKVRSKRVTPVISSFDFVFFDHDLAMTGECFGYERLSCLKEECVHCGGSKASHSENDFESVNLSNPVSPVTVSLASPTLASPTLASPTNQEHPVLIPDSNIIQLACFRKFKVTTNYVLHSKGWSPVKNFLKPVVFHKDRCLIHNYGFQCQNHAIHRPFCEQQCLGELCSNNQANHRAEYLHMCPTLIRGRTCNDKTDWHVEHFSHFDFSLKSRLCFNLRQRVADRTILNSICCNGICCMCPRRRLIYWKLNQWSRTRRGAAILWIFEVLIAFFSIVLYFYGAIIETLDNVYLSLELGVQNGTSCSHLLFQALNNSCNLTDVQGATNLFLQKFPSLNTSAMFTDFQSAVFFDANFLIVILAIYLIFLTLFTFMVFKAFFKKYLIVRDLNLEHVELVKAYLINRNMAIWHLILMFIGVLRILVYVNLINTIRPFGYTYDPPSTLAAFDVNPFVGGSLHLQHHQDDLAAELYKFIFKGILNIIRTLYLWMINNMVNGLKQKLIYALHCFRCCKTNERDTGAIQRLRTRYPKQCLFCLVRYQCYVLLHKRNRLHPSLQLPHFIYNDTETTAYF